MYCVVTTTHLPAWNTIETRTSLDYYELPPAQCSQPHNRACPHSHCSTPAACTCSDSHPTDQTECVHNHCASTTTLDCTCLTDTTCVRPSDHYPSTDGTSHPNCDAPHCASPLEHTNLTSQQVEDCPIPHCENPADHLTAQNLVTDRDFSVTLWYEMRMQLFRQTPTASRFAVDCKKFISYLAENYPKDSERLPLPEFPNQPDVPIGQPDRLLSDVIRSTHDRSTLKDRSKHANHDCSILSCPIKTLALNSSGSNTLSKITLSQMITLGHKAAASHFPSHDYDPLSETEAEESGDGLSDEE